MKFQCEKYILDNVVTMASRATAMKSPIAAVEGLLLEASVEGGVRITGYDFRKGIYADVAADVSKAGSIVLPAKIFGDIVRKLPDGIVTLSSDDRFMTHINCGQADYDFMGSDPADFPDLPDMDKNTNTITVSQSVLGSMIRQTAFAVSDNDSRPIYTGELLECDGEKLTMVALDGYRLAIRREEVVSCAEGGVSAIIPGHALNDVEKLCTSEDGEVSISVGQKFVKFAVDRFTLITRKLEGEFLNYHKAVPSEFSVRLKASRTELIRCADRVSLIIDDKTKNPLRCLFADGKLNISSATPLGRAEDNCVVEGDGKNVLMGLNNSYLLQALKAAPADTLQVNLNNGNSPIVFQPEDGGDGFSYMILPVRLRTDE